MLSHAHNVELIHHFKGHKVQVAIPLAWTPDWNVDKSLSDAEMDHLKMVDIPEMNLGDSDLRFGFGKYYSGGLRLAIRTEHGFGRLARQL